MNVQPQGLYKAFLAKDSRFDGRFFAGITSTGIYCRPVCRAKTPKEENCRFFSTAAQAEQAGFRPCLLCRPELAPGVSVMDASPALAQRAALLLEETCSHGQSLETLAGILGCSSRHLRRVFLAEYQVTPVQYLQTCRLLLAKNLLTDTNLSVLEVAMTAGFGSLRRFNTLFRTRYHLSPTALRKKHTKPPVAADSITLAQGYRPPYAWAQLIKFLALRTIAGVETVTEDAYMRTVQLPLPGGGQAAGWIRVTNAVSKNQLSVTVSRTLLPVLPQVLKRVENLFDLSCAPNTVYEALKSMEKIRPGLSLPGIRLPGCFEPFEMAVRAVLGQQITVKAAGTLAARFTQAFGTTVQTGIPGLTHSFPDIQKILSLTLPIENRLGPLGITAARSKTILALASALAGGCLSLTPGADPARQMAALQNIPGIGSWTAQYIAMRTLQWTDAFLETDAGVKKALSPRSAKEMLALAEAWRPWRSYAVLNLWNSLPDKLKKEN